MKKVNYFMMIFLAIHLLPVHADEHHPSGVIIDGTLGELERSELTGPDYTIKETYGERHGSNLFHSFEQFNLHTNETATFTGSEGIQNIISRVTGGNYSWINGTIRSEIPDANMYLINPFGVMFGPHASLDIDGSFHVTTADYLTLSDDNTFYADPTQKSLLTTSPPFAFGFIDDDCAPITFEGMGEINDLETNVTGLSVHDGKTISVIGGDIEFKKGTYYTEEHFENDFGDENIANIPVGGLKAPCGQINIASVRSQGKVILTDEVLDVSNFERLGDITLLEESLLDVSGEGAGSIFIVGNEFILDNSNLIAITRGKINGGKVYINTSSDIIFTDGGRCIVDTRKRATGTGADVYLISSGTVRFTGDKNILGDISLIQMNTYIKEIKKDGEANAGNLIIDAGKDILFEDGSSICSLTFGEGNTGNINLTAGNEMHFGGRNNYQYLDSFYNKMFFENSPKYFDSNNGVIASIVTPFSKNGNGGNITIKTKNIFLTDGYFITNATMGPGNAGNIIIDAKGLVSLKDAIGPDIWVSAIYTSSMPVGNVIGGNAGNVTINASNLSLESGACIKSGSLSQYSTKTYDGIRDKSGKAGNITIKVSNQVKIKGVNEYGYTNIFQGGHMYGSNIGVTSRGDYSGEPGKIDITTDTLQITEGAQIIAFNFGKTSDLQDLHGGLIDIEATEIDVSGSSKLRYDPEDGPIQIVDSLSGINTTSSCSAKAGDIKIDTKQLNLSNKAFISSSNSGIDGGAAGTITINATDSVYLNNSTLTTEAIKYNPENIHLNGKISVSGKNIHLYKSEITTSIQGGTGNGGDIQLNATKAITLNKSIVKANAFEGTGGNIDIKAGQFIQSSDSLVDASSEKGIDGTVNKNSSDTYAKSTITDLPENFLDASKLLNNRCEERTSASISRLMILGRDGSPTSPDDWLASPQYLSTSNHHSQDIHKGLEAYNNGNFQDAINYWTPYLSIDSTVDMDLIALIVSAYQAVGHLNKAVDILSDIFPQVTNQSSSYEKAVFFNLVGDLSLCMGDENVFKNTSSQKRMKNAYEYLNKGLHEAKLSKQPFILASLLNNMGNALSCSGDYDKAIACYEKSYDICKSLNKDCSAFQLRVITQINKGRAIIEQQTRNNVLLAIKNAIINNDNLPDTHFKAFYYISISCLIKKYQETIKDTQKIIALKLIAIKELRNAFTISNQLNDTQIMSHALGLAAQLYMSENNYTEAIHLTKQAKYWAQFDHPELLYQWQWQLGKLYYHEQQIRKAIDNYQNAIVTLNPSNKFSPPGVIYELFKGYRHQNNIFAEKIRPVYQELAHIYFDESETADSRLKEKKLRQVIDVMESLKILELQNYFDDECVTAVKDSFEIMDYPPIHSAILYPVPLKKKLVMIVAFPDRFISKTIHMPPEQINQKARQFREILDIDSKQNPKRFQRLARELYTILIHPLKEELNLHDTKILVIAPDEALRLMPFSPLMDGDEYLIENYAIVTIPAIHLTDMKPLCNMKKSNILLTGLTLGKPPLPFVLDELNSIKTIMGSGTVLLNEKFCISNMYEEFQNNSYDMVVISTHGVFSRSSKESYLKTYDGKLFMDDLGNMIQSGLYRKKQMELLSLSSCETAMGDERAALGLGGVALKSGAKSAIATLWSVFDEVSYLTTTEFYRQIKKTGMSKAKALQTAQLKLIDHERYNHPGFWSPFILIGNWL
jgi:filamentous hemagglutinin family protein